MFYCEKCRVENGWPESLMRSIGPCEMCLGYSVCYDTLSSHLPAPKSSIQPALPSFPGDFSEPIHEFFGLSYASYLVLPRTALQSMPNEWQRRLVNLIQELESKFGYVLGDKSYVVNVKDKEGKFIKDDIADYERGRRRIMEKEDG